MNVWIHGLIKGKGDPRRVTEGRRDQFAGASYFLVDILQVAQHLLK